jgi:hypothetical protein
VLRIVDAESSEECLAGEAPLTWNRTGPAGPSGPPGPSDAYAVPGTTLAVPDNPTSLVELELPAGSFVIQAKATMSNGSFSDVAIAQCQIAGDNDADTSFAFLGPRGSASNEETIALLLADTFAEPRRVTLRCAQNGTAYGALVAKDIHLVAVRVGALHGVRWDR